MISIIVPVYNGEDHLDPCVRSILKQTYENIQLILVNDGSTDATAALCDRWAEQDSRVLVLHQENAGVSAARNAGLDAATGDYIGFVDADDTIAPDTYEVAAAAIGDCDMVMWDAVTAWEDGRREEDTISLLPESRVLTRQDWSPALLRLMAGAAWRCLYRSELLQGVRFPVGIKLSEDRLFNLQAMGKAQSLQYLKKAMYVRSMRPGSAVHRYHADLFEKNLQGHTLAMQIIGEYWSEDYRPVYTRMFVIDGALSVIRQICGREYPGKSRLSAIRTVAGHEQVQAAFATCPPEGLQEKLLEHRAALLLRLVGMLYRWKHS